MITIRSTTVWLFVLVTLLGCGGTKPVGTAELPFKKLLANAEVNEASGNYVEAADFYRRAHQQKPRRLDLLYKSAELSRSVRDYRAAADAYQYLQDEYEEFPLVGLYYGRALKQDGRFDLARRALARFRESYNGADRPIVNEIVRNELAGIDLAERLPELNPTIELSRPGRGINTGVNEYGPVAVPGDQLFFTSNTGGQSRLYQSQLRNREWIKATVPPGFPVIAQGEFGTGSLSPDGRIFYFTICSGLTGTDARNRCEIFRGERTLSGNWSQPERLGDVVNAPGTNNSYPFITIENGNELLFFASDRKGGRGGMDLYQTSRPVGSSLEDFTPAANLGPTINTVSDEITPNYDPREDLLYFSSNGHPSIGGLDVFSSNGNFNTWTGPQNLGRPINSNADDYGFSPVQAGGIAYLTSNRVYPGFKDSTTDTDIFSLNLSVSKARLKANVFENTTGAQLNGATATLLEIMDDGREVEIESKVFPGGVYDFDLETGRRYRVVVSREGFEEVSYQVATQENTTALYGQPVFLKRIQDQPSTPEENPYSNPTVPEEDFPENTTVTPSAPPNTAPATPPTEVAVPPVAYRIQISAEANFDPQARKFAGIRDVGNLVAEDIPGRTDIQRIMVGYFTDPAEAKAALRKVQSNGFGPAFVVRYDDGVRKGRVNL